MAGAVHLRDNRDLLFEISVVTSLIDASPLFAFKHFDGWTMKAWLQFLFGNAMAVVVVVVTVF